MLAKLGLVGNLPACTDLTTKPWVIEAGVDVLDAPFVAGLLGVLDRGQPRDDPGGQIL